jgi:small-conductance mechanosensitive channel
LWGVLQAVLVFVAGFYLGRLYRRRVGALAGERVNLTPENRTIIANLGYYAIVVVTLLLALSVLGIDLTSLAIVAGAISVGIGFGLQNIVSNFISGVIMMFEKSVRVGDLVELPSGQWGFVRQMRLRATTVTTFDNIDIIVPNSSFISDSVINMTYEDSIRRLVIPFGVAYGSEVATVQRVVLEAIEQADLGYIRDDEARKPQVRMTALGNSSLDFVLVVWIDTANTDRPASYDFHFLPVIYEALNRAQIEIPFPQMDVHIRRT